MSREQWFRDHERQQAEVDARFPPPIRGHGPTRVAEGGLHEMCPACGCDWLYRLRGGVACPKCPYTDGVEP